MNDREAPDVTELGEPPEWPDLPDLHDPALTDDAVRGILERLDAVRTGAADDPTAVYADLHAALTAELDAPEGPRPHDR
ncbi:hypothetical protein GCM10011512_08350 [Tersicoccus solisilvae]|uniref:Uncharacterized protein n=1 Tax=Tersicoccus solisilvae TaxID=1882339 RepID=A0ABQ1NRS3_9MICC|nr:hypothetical protein [Tersicoccus solisilvae]GGC83889.1 hypothetical protein GCM10011512_08350 [Tersicoccus solisilvae]